MIRANHGASPPKSTAPVILLSCPNSAVKTVKWMAPHARANWHPRYYRIFGPFQCAACESVRLTFFPDKPSVPDGNLAMPSESRRSIRVQRKQPRKRAATPDEPMELRVLRSDATRVATIMRLCLPAYMLLGGGPCVSHAEEGGRRTALLVGCSRYDYLPSAQQLYGPANDVAIVRQMLVERFAFPEDRVTVLAESSGPGLRPTRANIVREFSRICHEAAPGDQIWIHMSGHGSRQPNQASGIDDHEVDGLDEIFCAADTRSLVGSPGNAVPGVIVDDEFRVWTQRMRTNGASVVIVFDTCHAGTASRGGARTRRIPPEQLISAAVIAKSTPGGQTRGARLLDKSMFDIPGGIVAIYAAQDYEEEKEIVPGDLSPLPENWYGLLTYTLVRAMNETDTPISYVAWLDRARAHYAELNYHESPLPFVEGSKRHNEVLGVRKLAVRPRIVCTRHARGYAISAGTLDGIVEGTVLAVYPASTIKNQLKSGHVPGDSVGRAAERGRTVRFCGPSRARHAPGRGALRGCEPWIG